MESDYAKRMKIQEICYKKKLSELQRNIMDTNRQMEVSMSLVALVHVSTFVFKSNCYSIKIGFFFDLCLNFMIKQRLQTQKPINLKRMKHLGLL